MIKLSGYQICYTGIYSAQTAWIKCLQFKEDFRLQDKLSGLKCGKNIVDYIIEINFPPTGIMQKQCKICGMRVEEKINVMNTICDIYN